MSGATSTPDVDAVVTKRSPRSVSETLSRLRSLIAAKDMTLFAVIDQSEAARQVGLELPATTLVIFGSPATGTPVMAAVPLAALDLPLKILIWAAAGQTNVSYVAPSTLADRFNLTAELARGLAGIDALTDALVAP